MKLTTIQSLNDLGSGSVLVGALEINIPSMPTIYLVGNTENVIFQGNEFIAFPFEFSELTASKGETPQFEINIDNTTRVIERYLLEYDNYLKLNGAVGNIITAKVYILNTNDLSEAVQTEFFQLTSYKTNSKNASFSLGTESLFTKTYPNRKMHANSCSFTFKDERCGYVGNDTTCIQTLDACRAKGNSVRFGAFAGLGSGYKI